jgi:hypothetical protein
MRYFRLTSWNKLQIAAAVTLLVGWGVLLGDSLEAPTAAPPLRTIVWVSVDGRSDNDGSAERPLDLPTALSNEGPVQPGTTVLIRGGIYRGTFISRLVGTPEAPIIVRQAPGERVTIDSGRSGGDALSILGDHTWFWGFEIMSSDPKRHSAATGSWPGDLRRGYGAVTRAPGTRFINLTVHDNANGLGLWAEAVGSDAYGNLVYNNGWQAPDRAHGHGIYTQNEKESRSIADNIIFNQFSHGIHAFGSDKAHLDNITFEGNIVFNNGALAAEPEYVRNLLLGGGRPALNPRLRDNMTYFDTVKSAGENNIGYTAGCVNLWARGNYLMGGRPLILGPCSTMSFSGNTLSGDMHEALTSGHPDNEYSTQPPAATKVFVRPNRCEPARAHVAIYNWSGQPDVAVDLSDTGLVVGERFVVRDVQNYFGSPIAQGTYDGGSVTVPMTGLRTDPAVGDVRSAAHTAPRFAALVVIQPEVAARTGTEVPATCVPSDAAAERAPSPLEGLLKGLGF